LADLLNKATAANRASLGTNMTGSIMGGIFEKKRPKPCQVKNTSIPNLFSLNSYQYSRIDSYRLAD
jgi:hypothetical protein